MAPSPTRDDEARYRVYAIELDESFGPRRRPDRPNIHLGVTCRNPAALLADGRAGRGPRTVRDHGLRVRSDLTRTYGPTTYDEARRQKRTLRERLMRCGYTVNGDTRLWTVYVIELDDGLGPRANPDLPWVYVGETSVTPEERYAQHITRARNEKGPIYAKVVADHHVGLRHDLYEDRPPNFTRRDALTAERELAEELARRGYSVRGGR